MIRTDNEHILFIEPKGPPAKKAVLDSIYYRMYYAYSAGKDAPYRFRGFHVCTGEGCSQVSSNTDRILATGQKTNSLCHHYLAFHRDEVPEEELEKIKRLPIPSGHYGEGY